MRREVKLALALAAFSGLVAAVGVTGWMSSQREWYKRQSKPVAQAIELTTVVVAKEQLEFGVTVTADKLEEIKWPAENVPKGSYRTVKALFDQQDDRVVLETMQASEPILTGKVTGPGQRASLSAMLGPGMHAVSIRVSDVSGVGGFVLPGDRVDIFVTRTPKGTVDKKGVEQEAYTDLLLQNMRVLAADQSADIKQATPKLVRTVTIEASLTDAQKITLASTLGDLSLILRENGSLAAVGPMARITAADLSGDSGDNSRTGILVPTNAVADAQQPVPSQPNGGDRRALAKINVVRAAVPTEYSVDRAGTEN